MAKTFNLHSKKVVDTDKKESKTKRTTNTERNDKKTKTTEKVVKRGRPSKVDNEKKVATKTKANKKSTAKFALKVDRKNIQSKTKETKIVKEVKHKTDVKAETKAKVTKSIAVTNTSTTRRWHNLETNKPQEFRPLEFNTNNKISVFGYKVPHGIITNAPYYIDKYRKENNVIEWQYISGCTNLSKCPREFPDCINCEIYQKRQKELKKNARS